MKIVLLTAAVLATSALFLGTAPAGPYEDGLAASKQGDHATALRHFRSLAEAGDPRAERQLGLIYRGSKGVVKDEAVAAEWFARAAQKGDAVSQYNLGTMYATGRGVERNYNQAVLWLRKAADQGNVFAQNNLGIMYAAGTGVAKDLVQAEKWFLLAAAQGNADALDNIERAARQMTPAQIAEAQKLAREWREQKAL